ncbi:gliding motility-associated C-terminal domain-containing protein [Fibrivirga algicola]|uniref:Gliding motility-associated C-terminal domain-containing protein n=1 Tax=Fibrivirga algicola TaxID=2950420 RepID=A0ABX0QGL6_9BACT|nr:gliding motility-associated C-terminal domain-containing protein [Fibrivirga algicola]NID10350.1 gliding motility-associated C-terminal domain-containing protein [Fibrivirga algicola]
MQPITAAISLLISLLLLSFSLANGQSKPVRQRQKTSQPALARKACLPAQITASKTVLCTGETIDLRSNILPSYRYRWFKDGAVIVGETTYLLTIDMPGMYKLEVTNTADVNCVQTDEIVIRQSPLKKISILPLTQQVACEGSSLVAAIDAGTATPTTASLTYTWQRNGFALPGGGPTLLAGVPGVYTAFVLDADCAVSSAPVEVFATPKPTFSTVQPLCNGVDPVTLSVTPAGGIFSGKGVQNGRFSPQLAGGGQHTITYSVTSTQGCPASVDQTIQVIDVPQPDLGPNQTIIVGSRVVLQGPVGPNLAYTWDPITSLLIDGSTMGGGGSRINLPQVTAKPNVTTTYHLTVSADSECPRSSSVTITVLPGLFYPSAFTPNGDGQNDVWAILGAEAFPLCSVRIYNRWGELIMSQSPYAHPWDGRVRGERVALGPYRYVISPAPFLPDRTGTLTVLD